VGLPADAVASLGFEAVISLVSGPFVEGSRIVASSTPVRISVSYRTPGQAHVENLPHVRRGQCNNRERLMSTRANRSWNVSPGSTWLNRQGWCVPGFLTPVLRADG
jgi:hypothetical protein